MIKGLMLGADVGAPGVRSVYHVEMAVVGNPQGTVNFFFFKNGLATTPSEMTDEDKAFLKEELKFAIDEILE